MLDRLFGPNIHNFLHLLGFSTFTIGLAFGKAFMSMGMLLMIANFLLEFKFQEAITNIRSNKLLLIIISFYLLLIIGLTWSIDFPAGLKELKSRLPLLAIPLIIGARPKLTEQQIRLILYLFLASVVVTSIINYLCYNQLIGHREYNDIRGMSLFASHIRYGMLIALGIGIFIHLLLKERKINVIYIISILWLLYYNYYSQILTGTMSVIMVLFATIIYLVHRWKPIASLALVASFCILSAILVSEFFNFEKHPLNLSKLPISTVNGNPYKHSNIAYSEINGQPLYAYYSEEEMLSEWLKVSDLNFYRNDRQDHLLLHTLVRYMTAKNLTKDSVGFQGLTAADIKNIEDGFTYPEERKDHLMSRINGVRHQLINNFDPNGHSLLQRFEYWKTSVYLIKKNWLIGVGTGGNQKAFNDAYVETNSRLFPENRFKSHNMYFSILISYGVFGFVIFCAVIFALFWMSLKNSYLIGVQFICVVLASFLIEDTLETQLGVSLFGFFAALLINHLRQDKQHASDSN